MSKNIVEIKGFDELERKIKQLGNDKDKRREVRLILRQEAKPVVNIVKGNTPDRTGSLKKSIGTIIGRKGRSKINPTVYVGPKVIKSKKKRKKVGRYAYGDGWYGHMVHGGHNIYYNPQNRKVKNRKGRYKSVLERVRKSSKRGVVGYVEPRPWIKISYGLIKTTATERTEKRLTKFIQRRINRLSK